MKQIIRELALVGLLICVFMDPSVFGFTLLLFALYPEIRSLFTYYGKR